MSSEEQKARVDHWDVKVYDDEGDERETIRGLNSVKKDTVMKIFEREGIQAQSMPYSEDGSFVHGRSESVNWGREVDFDGE